MLSLTQFFALASVDMFTNDSFSDGSYTSCDSVLVEEETEFSVCRSLLTNDFHIVTTDFDITDFNDTTLEVGFNQFLFSLTFHLEESVMQETSEFEYISDVIFAEELSFDSPQLQSGLDMFEVDFTQLKTQILSSVSQYQGSFDLKGQTIEYLVKLLEDVVLLLHDLFDGKRAVNYAKAIVTFFKLRTGQSFTLAVGNKLIEFYQHLFQPEVQGPEEVLKQIRTFFTNWESFKRTKVFTKVYKLVTYVLSMSLLEDYNINFRSCGYSKMEEVSIKRAQNSKFDFIFTLLDTISFLCEKGYQCLKSGTLSPIFHSSSSYCEWADSVNTIKLQSTLMNNPEIHGIDRFDFLNTLHKLIEQGKSMIQFMNEERTERAIIMQNLNALQMIKAKIISEKFLSETRRAPFCALLAGGSGIAKSTFAKILQMHFANVFGLSTASEYFYTLNPFDEFFSGFKSHVHTCLIDDIAFWKPSAVNGGDPTLMTVLQLANNISFVTPQADLADKGKIPFLCDHVIATTNTENLNAHAYFACPLAVQRRFPYVISILPKEQYVRNGGFIDGKSLPPNDTESYPNYWDITVKQVNAAGNDGPDRGKAKLKTIAQYTDINEFLRWYVATAEEHRAQQNVVLSSHDKMSSVTLCDVCHSTREACICENFIHEDTSSEPTVFVGELQSVEGQPNRNIIRPTNMNIGQDQFGFDVVEDLPSEPLFTFVSFYQYLLSKITDQWFWTCAHFWVGYYVIYTKYVGFRNFTDIFFGKNFMKFKIAMYSWDYSILKHTVKYAGHRIHKKFGLPAILITLGSILTVILFGASITSKITSIFSSRKEENFDVQGDVSENSGKKPVKKEEEQENVWFNDSYALSATDVSPQTRSRTDLSEQDFAHSIKKNIVTAKFSWVGDNPETRIKREVKGLCLSGNVYIFNNHSIPEVDELRCSLIFAPIFEGVNPNHNFLISGKAFKRFPERDLVMVEFRAMAPKANIIPYICSSSYEATTKGVYAQRVNGDLNFIQLERVQIKRNINLRQLNVISDVATAYCEQGTVYGDCGSILITKCHYGPQILGLHTIGDGKNSVCAPLFDRQFIEEKMKLFVFQIQSSEFMLSTPTIKRSVGDLHRKSTVRYMSSGSAEVYGTFTGFRPDPKTRVGPTHIQDAVLQRGYSITHDSPVMKGYEPWRIAALEMVNPNSDFKTDVLDECKEAFTNDILSKISTEDLDEIHVYDNDTAINGLAGYQYVDKMNRATSMGAPYRTSKKKYIINLQGTPDAPDRVTFEPEVMDRVDEIITRYQNGERAYPVFTGTLKDEPASFAKIAIKKTRVFCSGPVDFSIVARKYYLSLIRLMQKKRFVFEAAVGTVCQSGQWGDIRKYLVAHGEDQIVAGDYKFYDKKMSPQVILAAFDILIAIAAKAGFSENDLKVMRGVAVDTAYPLIDFNGDLIQFYGSNPSGHSLTVIINCLVNSLYIRVSFALTTGINVRLFKRYVNLMTYGDDNVMGISKEISDKFNHTSISVGLKQIGITYTMAEKERASVPLLHISEVSFLKRTWRWDDDVGNYLCPLEHASINKMLTVCVQSKTVEPEEQSASVISSALREYFFYGKKTFLKRREMFKQIIDETNLGPYVDNWTLPTYEELCDTFHSNTKRRN